ncbi:PREDICTED: uncharacterized protein LOC107065702 [Polistes dominula]|uniref:Uncharacterized protein LOC107065702 n=1 Tax=Polistes dominula TaxID=743375 RepID=A0ABM1I4I5_POLDO|nr:PREDICTED: uncharacterized protein LOC107065702 [Polistes dominula]
MPRNKTNANSADENKRERKVSKSIQCDIQTDEITRLQEQLKLLQLENETLKKRVDNNPVAFKSLSPNINVSVRRSPRKNKNLIKTESQIMKNTTNQKTCSCKGNCSSKVCGCVKNQRKCSPICKCNNQSCKNQQLENKENMESVQNKISDETVNLENASSKNETTHQHLFSPTNGTLHETTINIQMEGISFDTKKQLTYDSDENSKKKIVKKNLIKEKKTKQQDEDENDIPKVYPIFDPMKPNRQLPRTPPRASMEDECLMCPENNVSTVAETSSEKVENILPKENILEGLNQENVDLDKLSIVLFECSKCKRKFYPWRVKVHESACHKL